MRISDSAAAAIGALVVTGLAAALGVGAHAFLGEPEASPSFSPIPSPSPDPSETVGPDDRICALMDDMVEYSGEWAESLEELGLSINESMDEATLLAVFHDIGDLTIEGGQQVAVYLDQAAGLVTDPDTREAFETLADVTEEMSRIQGEAATDSSSLEEYMVAILDLENDTALSALIDEGDVANTIVEEYVTVTCGRDILGGGEPIDTSLKWDVNTLGVEVSIYYVDGLGVPVITEDEDFYYLDGVEIGSRSPGVFLFEQQINGPSYWCVSVASTADTSRVYRYSAQKGIEEGSCAALQP